jgi:hypothetical protein
VSPHPPCGVVWCGVVRCGAVWCGVVWCGVVRCAVVWRGVVWCQVWMLGVPPASNSKASAKVRVGDSPWSAAIPLTTAGTKSLLTVRARVPCTVFG